MHGPTTLWRKYGDLRTIRQVSICRGQLWQWGAGGRTWVAGLGFSREFVGSRDRVPWGPTLSLGQWGPALSQWGGLSMSGQHHLLQVLHPGQG